MQPSVSTASKGRRAIYAGLGAVFLLHLGVLATAHGATQSPRASVILQVTSMFLAALFATLAAARSRGFARNFWILTSSGFVMMFVGLLRWQFAAVEEFELFSLLFLFHMVPFGLALLLNDRPRMDRTLNWPMFLDFLQVLLMVAILYVEFIYLPSRGASEEQLNEVQRYFGFLLISRNVVMTGGYWARALLAGSRREILAFRTMAIYLSIYTAVSAVGQYVFLTVHPWTAWLDLNGSVPMLAGAWLFSQWQDLPSEQEPRSPGFRAVLGLHLIPAFLPVVVAILASSLAKREARLAWIAVILSWTFFSVRLLVTIYSERRATEARLQAESRYQLLFEEHQEIESKNLLLKELAHTDGLTGLANRRAIEDWATRQIGEADRHSFSLWVVLMDLDHFKSINDKYGHEAGDTVLKKLSDILKGDFRRSDICGRMGGEEFIFVLTHASQKDAKLVAERVRVQLESTPFDFGGKSVVVTASFGIAGFEKPPAPDFNQLVAQADTALYSAKRLGRNRVEVST